MNKFQKNYQKKLVVFLLLFSDLDDPAKATGSEEEIMNMFREIRSEIEKRINSLVS